MEFQRCYHQKESKESELMGFIKKKLKEGEDPNALKKALEREGSDPRIVDEIMRKV